MNEYEETQAGKQLSDEDEIFDPDDMTAHDAGAPTQVEIEEGLYPQAAEPIPLYPGDAWPVPGNIMHALTLYRSGESWVYDDPRFNRVAEPLVLGASEILDQIIVFDLGTYTRSPITVVFSSRPFPKAHMGKLMSEEDGGFWYSIEGKEAWLCGCLLDYFETAPDELFVKVTGRAQPQSVGAIARAEAMIAGDPDWAEVTRWPREALERRADAEMRDAYDLRNPKHPEYHSTHADLWDLRERG